MLTRTTKTSQRKRGKRHTTSATAILGRVAGRSAKMHGLLERERLNAAVARQIYEARTSRNLSQTQLAELIGTKQSVIARLEDADYQGHSLTMLRRIADALGYEVEVRFIEPAMA